MQVTGIDTNINYKYIMEKRIIASAKAPKAVGTYSQAVVANGTIYVSGQLPIDAQTGEFVPGGVREQ